MTRNSVTVDRFTPVASGEDIGLDNDPMLHLIRVFVYFLQNLYRDFPRGCGMQWEPNEEVTELVITDEKPRLESIESRPHITCVLDGARFAGLGLDQLQSQRASDGQRTHTDLVPMNMTYHCQAKEGIHARRIAWNSSFYTIMLRRIIMRAGGLFQVGVQHQISAEGPITQFTGPSAENQLVEVTVKVPFYWQPQWRIKRAAEVWRRMRMNLHVNEVQPFYSAGRAAQVRPPMVKGVPVRTTPIPDPPGTSFVQVVVGSNFGEEE